MAASTSSTLNTASPPTPHFKLHIAIDFGTDGTGTVWVFHLWLLRLISLSTAGLAYAYNNEVFVHSRWSSKKYGDAVKPKTILLLDDDLNTLGFGVDAKFKFVRSLSLHSLRPRWHIMSSYISMPFHKDKWMLFERFKMALYGMFSLSLSVQSAEWTPH